MTTFTMQDLNNTEVTKEEEEVFKTMAEMGRVDVDLKVNAFETPVFTLVGEPLPNQTPDVSTIITNICAQLQLLSTVIKEGAGRGNVEDQSLQDCVSATLEQAEWFKEMVEEAVAERVEGYLDDRDFDQEVVSAVEYYFSESFRLDDHVDIEHVVEDRLNHATITVQF